MKQSVRILPVNSGRLLSNAVFFSEPFLSLLTHGTRERLLGDDALYKSVLDLLTNY